MKRTHFKFPDAINCSPKKDYITINKKICDLIYNGNFKNPSDLMALHVLISFTEKISVTQIMSYYNWSETKVIKTHKLLKEKIWKEIEILQNLV
jgi:hypothetical protein